MNKIKSNPRDVNNKKQIALSELWRYNTTSMRLLTGRIIVQELEIEFEFK